MALQKFRCGAQRNFAIFAGIKKLEPQLFGNPLHASEQVESLEWLYMVLHYYYTVAAAPSDHFSATYLLFLLDSEDENDLESEIFFIPENNVRTFSERSVHISQCAQ